MGLTITNLKPNPPLLQGVDGGSRKVKTKKLVTVAFDDSYSTGGESLVAADVDLTAINFVLPEPFAGFIFEYDYTNALLLAYYVDNDAVADSALIQVPDTTDLSAVTAARLLIIGDA
jgi:hypothetical protein